MKKGIKTQNAPAAVGPYSQGCAAGGMIFTSGQLPLSPASGEFAGGGIKGMTVKCLENIEAILLEAGSSRAGIVKTTIFMTDLASFGEVNAAYEEFFGDAELPARSCVQVAALPKGAEIEIEAVAVRL